MKFDRYYISEDFLIEYICDLEVNSIINDSNKDYGYLIFSDLIKDMDKKINIIQIL